jgi:hypothetical protein
MLTLLLLTHAHAGGWTQPRGAHYLKVWSRTLIGGQGFLADGGLGVLDASYRDVALGVYGEWGLRDDWTLVVSSTPLGLSQVIDRTVYTGSTLLGVRRALATGNLKVAAEARVGGTPPVGDAVIGAGAATPVDELSIYDGTLVWYWQPAVATAQAEAEAQVGYGLPWGWVTATAGGRWTSSAELPEAILASAGVGRSGERLTVSFSLSTLQPLAPVTEANVSGAGATRYIGVEPAVSLRLTERTSLALSGGGAMMAQANAATPALNIGIEHR